MTPPHTLPADVADARLRSLTELEGFAEEQARRKPAPGVWNAGALTEHLFGAEQGGIWGMWKPLQAQRPGAPGYAGELPLSGPPDVRQRWQFRRFHIDGHPGPRAALRQHAHFPA